MAEALIQVGRVAGAFGVRGEVRLSAYTEDPLALVAYKTLLRQDGSPGLTITQGRPAKGGLVCRCLEIQTKEQADTMRGLRLYIPRAALPEPDEDEFYLTDLIGLQAETPSGALLGRIKSVQDFGAGDILEIAPAEGGPTWYLPFTREAVPQVKIAEGRVIVVKPIEVE